MKILIICLPQETAGEPAVQERVESMCVPRVGAHPGAPRGTGSRGGCFDAVAHSRSHETGGAETGPLPTSWGSQGLGVRHKGKGLLAPARHPVSADQIGRMPKLAIPKMWSEPQPKLYHHHISRARKHSRTKARRAGHREHPLHPLRTS